MATSPATANTEEASKETYYPIDDLAQFLRKHRDGCPSELARELLRYDRPGCSLLVGISTGAHSAFLLNVKEGYVVDIPIEGDGLADLEGPIVHGHGKPVEIFARKLNRDTIWLHPRYR